ncbi:hypothetical protein GH733_006514 [Mirounga leonina]|nr:hypothetical protein GH733_006514 [Mirounga leonina]
MPFVISGSCHCGKCICSAEEWYISGELCDCDDRDCDKHDGLVCTGVVAAEHEWDGFDYERLWLIRTFFNLVPFGHDGDPPCIFLQGMESVIAGTVSAGMDGTEMHVKSGLAQSILNSYIGEDWSLSFSIRTI